jgi:ankyrin repeat protein
MRAARGGDALVMRLLRDAGADPALTQANGNTALHVAVGASRGGNNPDRSSETSATDALAYCLELGADVNAMNSSGDTPLHLSVASPATVEFLVARGANINIKNKQGRTPLDLALRARDANASTVALLRRLGGTATTP